MIVLSNISKVFDNGKLALTAVDNVNLTIEQGQIYGIIGYSGAGKSTLIRLLNGLEKPSAAASPLTVRIYPPRREKRCVRHA